jgi:hypothetical protein
LGKVAKIATVLPHPPRRLHFIAWASADLFHFSALVLIHELEDLHASQFGTPLAIQLVSLTTNLGDLMKPRIILEQFNVEERKSSGRHREVGHHRRLARIAAADRADRLPVLWRLPVIN